MIEEGLVCGVVIKCGNGRWSERWKGILMRQSVKSELALFGWKILNKRLVTRKWTGIEKLMVSGMGRVTD
jgi:hypothetical protein